MLTRWESLATRAAAWRLSLLAVKLKDVKAVVLGAGIYDFKKAYDEIR